jgi:hypothetical protein
MPDLRHPYNYCERDDDATTWAVVTEFEMRMRKMGGLAAAIARATPALQRLAVAIGGVK